VVLKRVLRNITGLKRTALSKEWRGGTKIFVHFSQKGH
jgi:hypothetical protein